MIATTVPTAPDPNSTFVQHYLPEIESRSRQHFSRLDPDGREEAVQESSCMAWRMFMSAHERGRIDVHGNSTHEGTPPITACSLAWFANRSYDSGRRFAGPAHVRRVRFGSRPQSTEPKGRNRIRPKVKASTKEGRLAVLDRIADFLRAYRAALAAFFARARDTLFPQGTWQLARRLGVPIADSS